jgi:SAM-dependent methyltransferase
MPVLGVAQPTCLSASQLASILRRMDPTRRTQLTYDAVAGEFSSRTHDRSTLMRWMLAFQSHLPRGRVLDLGAGPCHDTARLRDLGLDAIALDRSRGMLQVARDEVAALRIQADMRHLPLSAQCVAGVWASASLLHLPRADFEPALAGIRRVLMPSGALFASLKCGSGAGWDTARYGADAPRWFTYWSESELDAVLCSAGFEIIEAESLDFAAQRWLIRVARVNSQP